MHVLPGSHYEALKLWLWVLGNALIKNFSKLGLGSTQVTWHPGEVELEVGPHATAQLQQGELPGGGSF